MQLINNLQIVTALNILNLATLFCLDNTKEVTLVLLERPSKF